MTIDASIASLLRADETLAPDVDSVLRTIRHGVALRRRRRRSVAIGGAAFAAAAVVAVPSLVSQRDTLPAVSVAAQPAAPVISLVTAPAAPDWFGQTLGTVPEGWHPYPDPQINRAHTSLYASDSVPVHDFRQTISLFLSTEQWAPGELTDTVDGKSALITRTDDAGNARDDGQWNVVIDSGGSLRSRISFPAELNGLTREQVITIAASMTIHDRTDVAVG